VTGPRATLAERLRAVSLATWVELFSVGNLAFLAVDILIAHAANDFARRAEWIPILFSASAPLLLVPGLVSERLRERARLLGLVVAGLSILVGVAGMLFHLESAFFERQTLHHLVYSAPFVAPLSYVGVGFLLLLNRMERNDLEWSRWVVFLALGGFVGNLALALLDHAQNGFFRPSEWIGVVAAAFGTSFLLLVVLRPFDVVLRRACGMVLWFAAGVGLLGFALHLAANAEDPAGTGLRDRLIYGAPAFAPLLFTNLALLAGLGLLSLARATREPTPSGVA
jgi:hypothetical protein